MARQGGSEPIQVARGGTVPGPSPPAPKKKLSSRRARRRMFAVLGGLAIVAIVAILLFAGAAPEGYLTVSQVQSGPYTFKEVKVRGDVIDWNAKAQRFALTDNLSSLMVDYVDVPGGIPPSFASGKHVVVRGVMQPGYLDALEITVGCPPEYNDG